MLCSNFVKFGRKEIFGREEIGEIVHCLPDKKKQNFVWLSSCRYCADRAQNLPGPSPTMYSECSRFHPNRFTFGGVIAERVNTAKTRRKVNQIGWSIASSRIIKNYNTYAVVHNKRSTLFFTVTPVFLGGFLHFVCQQKQEWTLYRTGRGPIKFTQLWFWLIDWLIELYLNYSSA